MTRSGPDPEAPPLLDRDLELARLDALVAAARAGTGAVLALEGPPGIGKTRLVAAAALRAGDGGVTVMAAAASPLEREFGFGVARHLFEPALREAGPDLRERLLEGPARLAAPALGLDPAPGPSSAGEPDARYAVVHGLHWLVANLAAREPLLIAVDDLQWADAASQRFLAYLARRIAGSPVALLVALRPPLPGEDRALVEALLDTPAAEVLTPGPLGEDAVAALAERALGEPVGAAAARAWHRATGGNALLVDEVLSEARAGEPSAPAVIGLERVARRVGRRLDALGDTARSLAEAVAVLGDGCALDMAARLARLPPTRAAEAAAALAAADVLADDSALRFRHPVVRAAVADRPPAVRRAEAHRRAAGVVAERGAPPAAVAAHLRQAAPAGDPWAVERLEAAADEAMGQGSPELAADHLARALCEPPPRARRAGLLRRLGVAEARAGRPEAIEHLRAAVGALPTPTERARAGLTLAGVLFDATRTGEAAEAARAARAQLGDRPEGEDRELALTLSALLADCVRMDLDVAGDEERRLRTLAATLPGDTPGERFVLISVDMMTPATTAAGHAAAAERLAGALAEGLPAIGTPETGVISNLIRAERLEAAQAFTEAGLAEARDGGLVPRYALMLGMRGWIEAERGALREAEADVRRALELGAETRTQTRPLAGVAAATLVELGDAEKADAMLAAHALDGLLPPHQVFNLVLLWRAGLRAAQGRRDEALADVLELGARYERWGIRRAVPPWRSSAAVLLAARGERDRARALAEEELDLAQAWGTPGAIGTAQRGLGLVTGEVEQLAAAVRTLERSAKRLELARAHVELGAALRRAGRRTQARGPLGAGMDVAQACGATPLAERARQELRATGARPRRLALSGVDALTASERRVAEHAARGLTNRAIAQELFVTPATVETHLRHAFRKLDVRSREQLGAVLSGAQAEKIRVSS